MSVPAYPEVWLSENAFISMVTAAVEAFPDETLGVIIGLREPEMRRNLVQYAVVYQTAERAKDAVEADLKRKRRTDKFLERVTRLGVIGDFHSHPESRVGKISSCWLSPDDKKSMQINDLGFVIAIDRDSKEREWHHLSRGSLIGCVFPHSLKITAWYKAGANDYNIAQIHCPFALGLGR